MTGVLTPVLEARELLAGLERLAAIGATPSGGVSRPAFSEADLAARAEVVRMMRGVGLDVTTDPAGNVFGRPAGADARPLLLMGSHLDSVAEGGRYDGTYGVLAAIEVVRALRDHGLRLGHPVGVVVFADEEGTFFPRGLWGSRAVVGDLNDDEIASLSDPGRRHRFEAAGGQPGSLAQARLGTDGVAGYLELHVEQGPELEAAGGLIGVVEGITGRMSVDVVVEGQASHAGTTPMTRRRDGLVAASEMVLAIRALAGAVVRVATVGDVVLSNPARNVVPGRVRLLAELRDLRSWSLAAGEAELRAAARRVAARHGLRVGVERIGLVPPASCDPRVRKAVAEAADLLGVPHLGLPSGAGHDAQMMARIAPTGMVFVPSAGGVSHAPGEYTDAAALVTGVRVLLQALVACDRQLAAPGSGRCHG
jgi:hydantoinase/carbamoylase family amidase